MGDTLANRFSVFTEKLYETSHQPQDKLDTKGSRPTFERLVERLNDNHTFLQTNTSMKRSRASTCNDTSREEDERKLLNKKQHEDPCRRQGVPRVQDFMEVAPHPYGFLPSGNKLFCGNTNTSRQQKGNSSILLWLILDDQHHSICHAVLSFCNGADLARLSQTCRFLYAACHQLELWRDLVLYHLDSARQQRQPKQKTSSVDDDDHVLQQMQSSWKDTYVQLYMTKKRREGATAHPQKLTHSPIVASGVYSDYFYRLHSCRNFSIPDAWLDPQQLKEPHQSNGCCRWAVPIVSSEEMTVDRFYEEFEEANRPVLVRGAAKDWKATRQWSTCIGNGNQEQNCDYLLQQTQGCHFRATSGAAPLPAQFTLSAYQQYCNYSSQLEEAPLYLFDRTALQPHVSPLWKDFYPDLQRTCPYWDSDVCPQHDLFRLLGEGRRPDHTWWIVGPQRSGSVFHMDPNATHAWNAAICGRKRWIFYPPGVPPPGVFPSADADQVALPLTVGEWMFQYWSQHRQRLLHTSTPAQQPLEVTAHPGDVVFVPHGWWHMVINLDEGMNIAITHNYVSRSNLPNVLKFLDQKQDQISGCRDRAESIKPDCLYEAFCGSLQEHYPNWLKGALQVPDWTCRAWSSNSATKDAPRGNPNKKKKKCKECSDRPEPAGLAQESPVSLMAKAKTKNDGEGPDGFTFSFL